MTPEHRDAPLLVPAGFRASAVKAGIKPSGGLDLAILIADHDCAAAGTFTTNRVAAAPVHWNRAILPSAAIRAIVINSGNANAATGAEGLANARSTAAAAASLLGCRTEQVLVASTGVIGHQLPMPRVEAGVRAAFDAASADVSSFQDVSRAILTTDTHPKVVSKRLELAGRPVTLLGLAKGAAMIGPNMATMLGFLLTDAPVAPDDLRRILSAAVEDSFNCISVEGHMSTNDTVLILAGGKPGDPPLEGADLDAFGTLVQETCVELARMIPGDGEGATHRITIDVEGARDRAEARAIARSVADSALVKTAIHGADPNWGRIVSAAGYAGVEFDESELSLWLNEVPLYQAGTPLPFDDAAVSANLRDSRETHIRLVFTRGDASIRFWTCDLTAEYVRLNADYTT
jgi:glutamate N-acetyltransferase/amino-acid N-acetyltransferase